MNCTQKKNKELTKENDKLTKENDKLRQQVQSKTVQIELLQHKLYAKEVLLRESDISKNDAKDVLEDMKVEMERIGKRITKQLFRLKDPPLNEVVPINRNGSLESLSTMPKSTPEDSRSETECTTIDHGSDQEEMSNGRWYRYEPKDSDIESDQASSIRSVKTIIHKRIFSGVNNLDETLQDTATSKQSNEDIPAIKVEQPLRVQPTRITETSDEQSDELATQSDTNSSAFFTRPVQVKSPSGSELSDAVSTDAKVLKSKSSRHTKELVAQPLLTHQQKQRLGALTELPSASAGYETKDKKPTATQPDEDCDFMRTFKRITQKSRPS